MTTADLTAEEERMLETWQQHVYAEFAAKDVAKALETMTEDAYVNNVPIATGAVGKRAVAQFYARCFVEQLPADIESTLVSITIGQNRIVEESVFSFTHSLQMDWFLPGWPPTGKRVEIAVVAIVQFRDGKIEHEHLHWDQGSVLAQLGLIDELRLPVVGALAARRLRSTVE
jgi:carboxymethylenebutenolidase